MTGRRDRWAAAGRLAGPSLVVVLLWLVATVVPAALDSTDDDLSLLEEEQAILQSDLAEARAIPDEPDELDRRIAAARTAVPDTAELAAFVRSVDEVGDRSGVSVEQIAPLSVAGADDVDSLVALPSGTSSITISVGASGSYEAAMAFASELGRLERLVVTDLIALTSDEEDSSRVVIDLELRIFTTEQLVVTPQLDDELLDDGLEDGTVDGELEAAAGRVRP